MFLSGDVAKKEKTETKKDKTGKLLFYKSGKMSDNDMKKIFGLIEENL